MGERASGPCYAASVWPWTRCAVCGYRKWTHWLLSDGEFYVYSEISEPPKRSWFA